MRRAWSRSSLLLTLFVVTGCAAGARPSGPVREDAAVSVSGVVIENGLVYGVTDVMIESPATGAFAGCGNLMPRTSCSNRFPGFDYRGTPVVIRWQERGEPHQTPDFVIQAPETLSPGEYVVRVVIFAPGQAGAKLVPAADDPLTSR